MPLACYTFVHIVVLILVNVLVKGGARFGLRRRKRPAPPMARAHLVECLEHCEPRNLNNEPPSPSQFKRDAIAEMYSTA